MQTRIRYGKTKVVKLESKQEFNVKGQKMVVEISGDKKQGFWISLKNLEQGNGTLKGPFQTLPEAMKSTKTTLQSLGVAFGDETRERLPRAVKSAKVKRGPGRPKGSKNKPVEHENGAAA